MDNSIINILLPVNFWMTAICDFSTAEGDGFVFVHLRDQMLYPSLLLPVSAERFGTQRPVTGDWERKHQDLWFFKKGLEGLRYYGIEQRFSTTVSGHITVSPHSGKTSQSQWLTCIHNYPAPWAELATENIILTVPADSICSIEDPEPLLTLWEKIMAAIAQLAAVPARFPLPERIVADVQISAGWMHSGYPIMCHLESVKELVNMEYMKANGLWGPTHELGHNQQRAGWEFPPNTTEATCNLWSVYVHEKVLGIPRNRAHEELQLQRRKKRISDYVGGGAQLNDWNVWTALETYLQLQEAFGWEPFIQLFSDYQTISSIPGDNPAKMNLWAEKFSLQVKKNLVPFFVAWGWPINGEVSKKLATLPNWDKNPMKKM